MFASAPVAASIVYRPRRPENSVLYQAVAQHLPAFLSSADEADRPVPRFVRREFEAFLACGIAERGAVRARCRSCGFDRLIAFSCKSRSGLCASCATRRMVDVVTHLCEHVIPDVPVRQWVMTVPPPVRYVLAYNSELLTAVIRIFVYAVFAHLRSVARRELDLPKGARIEAGAVCVPQRFNSALALSPHLHVLAADGVWVQREPGVTPTFHALPAPTTGELATVAWSTCERTVELLKKRGMWSDADPNDDRLPQKEPLLAALAIASITGVLAMGPNAGQRPMRLYGRAALSKQERLDTADKAPANGYGFDLHAGARAAAHDKKARQRLCGYLLRPPLSNDRLTRTESGEYRIAFKRVWDNGAAAIVVSGQELLARLALLVPPPRVHTTRYLGVFAPRSVWRRLIVPESPATSCCASEPEPDSCEHAHRYRLSWAQALCKVYDLDLGTCPRCGCRGMQQIAVIRDPRVLRAILASLQRKQDPP